MYIVGLNQNNDAGFFYLSDLDMIELEICENRKKHHICGILILYLSK